MKGGAAARMGLRWVSGASQRGPGDAWGTRRGQKIKFWEAQGRPQNSLGGSYVVFKPLVDPAFGQKAPEEATKRPAKGLRKASGMKKSEI